MLKVKNVRAGIVIVSDAGLKLAPGEVVELPQATAQVSRAIEAGLLRVVEPAGESKPETRAKAKPAAKPVQKTQQAKAPVAADSNPAAGNTDETSHEGGGNGEALDNGTD